MKCTLDEHSASFDRPQARTQSSANLRGYLVMLIATCLRSLLAQTHRNHPGEAFATIAVAAMVVRRMGKMEQHMGSPAEPLWYTADRSRNPIAAAAAAAAVDNMLLAPGLRLWIFEMHLNKKGDEPRPPPPGVLAQLPKRETRAFRQDP